MSTRSIDAAQSKSSARNYGADILVKGKAIVDYYNHCLYLNKNSYLRGTSAVVISLFLLIFILVFIKKIPKNLNRSLGFIF
jgi:hypothetical protein